MSVLSSAAIVRKGMELFSNLVSMIDSRATLRLRTDMVEFIVFMMQSLEGANYNNSAVDALLQQLRDRLSSVRILYIYPPTGPELHHLSVKEFAGLLELNIHQCPLSTIPDLIALRQGIIHLSVTNSGIVDISEVLTPDVPKKIKSKLSPIILPGSNCQIPIRYSWLNLTRLTLSNCGIVRMDVAFHFFPALTHLDLSKNDIMHIAHLHNCINLESLNLSYNRIRVLSNLERVIGRVKRINLSHNDIESLDGVDKVYGLEKINVSFNFIDDMNEIQHLCRLPCLESVLLHDNPIADLANYRLRFYHELIVHGTVMNGNRPFPSLDRQEIMKSERKKLR
jgi:Leucine-rich repeat (LRR) protein